MSSQMQPNEINRLISSPVTNIGKPVIPDSNTNEGSDFKSVLLDSLDEVNKLQIEANKGVEKLALGETDNVAEVFSAVRKADVAFSMLMEMRNKLEDAYNEIQQMRV